MTSATNRPRAAETAVADANVLFSHHQRNVYVTLAAERLFSLRWSQKIEREWFNALSRNRPDLSAERLRRTVAKMNEALTDARIEGYEQFEALLTKTDAKDRHVAAAAVGCAPSSLVTWNLQHFNAEELAAHGVSLTDPDGFLCRTFDREPEDTLAATERASSFLRRRPTWNEYVETLDAEGLHGFVERLRRHKPKNELTDDRSPGTEWSV